MSEPQAAKPKEAGKKKQMARLVHMHAGVELIGSKTSLAARRGQTELEVTALGVVATNKEGRCILIPWANIRGCELLVE